MIVRDADRPRFLKATLSRLQTIILSNLPICVESTILA